MHYILSLEAQPLYFEGIYSDRPHAIFTQEQHRADTFRTSEAAAAAAREAKNALGLDLVIVIVRP